jgi:hypothetical protein
MPTRGTGIRPRCSCRSSSRSSTDRPHSAQRSAMTSKRDPALTQGHHELVYHLPARDPHNVLTTTLNFDHRGIRGGARENGNPESYWIQSITCSHDQEASRVTGLADFAQSGGRAFQDCPGMLGTPLQFDSSIGHSVTICRVTGITTPGATDDPARIPTA